MTSLPLFQLDTDKLDKIQDEIPNKLQILRLRLRFGLPLRVQFGQKFRVVVDLVDEMGQPIPKGLLPPSDIDISLFTSTLNDYNKLVLNIEDELVDQATTQTKWISWVSVNNSSKAKDFVVSSEVSIKLKIQLKQAIQISNDSSSCNSSRHQLQFFCAGSSWLNDKVLVLPLQISLKVTNSNEDRGTFTSTICERLFRSSLSTKTTENNNFLVIEENYGDAMGSHVWDASILVSFALIQAGIINLTQKTVDKTTKTILELGSGCGLFAVVLATQQFTNAKMTTIFTEKTECLELLKANLARNNSPLSTSALALKWGATLPKTLLEDEIRVVFAADVLYNWATHEVFLKTLDSLIEEQKSTNIQVFLAHKRRGNSSAAKLDALASGTFDMCTECTSDCRWLHWKVKKLASVGRVDLFLLSFCGKH